MPLLRCSEINTVNYIPVDYDEHEMYALKWDVQYKLRQTWHNDDCIARDVISAVSSLKHGKCNGFYGLTSDHIIRACNDQYVHTADLSACLVSHGVVTDNLAYSTMTSIPKGSSSNRTVSVKYRAITLSFNSKLYTWHVDSFDTSYLQFGFKNCACDSSAL